VKGFAGYMGWIRSRLSCSMSAFSCRGQKGRQDVCKNFWLADDRDTIIVLTVVSV
jgi:hypothetical protein